jgi:Holliday junction DNA helicase RuvA
MIVTLKGKVILKSSDLIYLDVSNVGYEINCVKSLNESAHLNEEILIFICQIIKEDKVDLYGFKSLEEKIWFEGILTINGLGPKTAIAILSSFSIASIENAIITKDSDMFLSISGIGKKIALRMINELESQLVKIRNRLLSFQSINDNIKMENNLATKHQGNIINETAEALSTLGFNKKTLYKELADINLEHNFDNTEQLIKMYLKKFDKSQKI